MVWQAGVPWYCSNGEETGYVVRHLLTVCLVGHTETQCQREENRNSVRDLTITNPKLKDK